MNDFFDDVGAYLLDALEPDEHEAFEAALADDVALRAEVDRLRVAAEALACSPVQMAAPAALKGRLMAVVESEAQLLAAAGPEPRRSSRTMAVLKPGWWSVRPGLALAATLLVLVLGGAGALVGQSVLGDSSSGTVTAETGDAQLITKGDGDHATLVIENLGRPADGNVYQVWLQHEGGEEPVPTNALFSTRHDETASVDVPGSLEDVEAVLVTEEPAGGSQTPTTDPVVLARPS